MTRPISKRTKVVRAFQVFHSNDMTPVMDEHEYIICPDKDYLKYHWRERIFKVVEVEIRPISKKGVRGK